MVERYAPSVMAAELLRHFARIEGLIAQRMEDVSEF